MVYKVILLSLLLLSLLAKNKNFAIASFVVLVLTIFKIDKAFEFVEKWFLDMGMIILMIWMLVPLSGIRKDLSVNLSDFISLKGIVSLISGILVAILAAKGTVYLKGNVDVITGVIVGSLFGVAVLGGVPVGPLIASGLAYEIMKILGK